MLGEEISKRKLNNPPKTPLSTKEIVLITVILKGRYLWKRIASRMPTIPEPVRNLRHKDPF